MRTDTQKSGWFRRVWQSVLETSEVAVSIHYGAPWSDARPAASSRGPNGPEVCACA